MRSKVASRSKNQEVYSHTHYCVKSRLKVHHSLKKLQSLMKLTEKFYHQYAFVEVIRMIGHIAANNFTIKQILSIHIFLIGQNRISLLCCVSKLLQIRLACQIKFTFNKSIKLLSLFFESCCLLEATHVL